MDARLPGERRAAARVLRSEAATNRYTGSLVVLRIAATTGSAIRPSRSRRPARRRRRGQRPTGERAWTCCCGVDPVHRGHRQRADDPDDGSRPNGCNFTHSRNDLNGDGFDDTVVGDPYATVNGKAEAGSITVLFGDADGRIGESADGSLPVAGSGGSGAPVRCRSACFLGRACVGPTVGGPSRSSPRSLRGCVGCIAALCYDVARGDP